MLFWSWDLLSQRLKLTGWLAGKSAEAVGERKVEMELRFKWIFAKKRKSAPRFHCLANCFPPFPEKCKTYGEVEKVLPHRRFFTFPEKVENS